MNINEIKEKLEAAKAGYIVFGKQYVLVLDGRGVIDQSDFPDMQTASVEEHEGEFLVIGRDFEDEQDVVDVKSFCDLYTGQ